MKNLWPAIKAMLGIPGTPHVQGPPPQGGSGGRPKPRSLTWRNGMSDDEIAALIRSIPPHYDLNTTIKVQRTFGNGSDIGSTETISVGEVIPIKQAIIANQTNKAIAFAFANAKLKVFCAYSDVAMTVKTNDGSSPQETLHLLAGIPYIWTLTGSYIGSAASPFGGDVTGLFVTNTGAGTLQVLAGVDPT